MNKKLYFKSEDHSKALQEYKAILKNVGNINDNKGQYAYVSETHPNTEIWYVVIGKDNDEVIGRMTVETEEEYNLLLRNEE